MKTKQLIDSFGIATMYNDFVDVQTCMRMCRDKAKNMDLKNFMFRKDPLANRNVKYKKWYKIGDIFSDRSARILWVQDSQKVQLTSKKI